MGWLRLWWVVEGVFWCAAKGMMALVFRLPVRERDWMKRSFGWNTPLVDPDGRDIWAEQITLPRGGKSHHRTDLIVEWNRKHPERGAKLMLGLTFAWFGVSLVLAGILAYG